MLEKSAGNKKWLWIILATVAVLIIAAVVLLVLWHPWYRSDTSKSDSSQITTSATSSAAILDKQTIVDKFSSTEAKEWGLDSTGVKTKLDTTDKVIALTFDACGGPGGSDYNKDIIDYLSQNNIPATLFINSRWIDANPKKFEELSKNSLFEIANHGTLHKPCSINGKEAYGIKGTANVSEMVDEILGGADKIKSAMGISPKYYRAGTAFTDEVCPQVAGDLGEQVVNFSVNGDAGATAAAATVRDKLIGASSGDIVIMHMNHPEGGTAEGLKLAIPELQNQGFRFAKLSDYKLK